MRKKVSASVMKRTAMLVMLVIACFALSACYMDPDRVVDNQNGLNPGEVQQDFDNVLTPTPTVTATPTPTPATNEVDWSDWDFGNDTATNIPSNPVQPTINSSIITPPTGVPSLPSVTGSANAGNTGSNSSNTPRPTTNTSSATPTPTVSSLKLGSSGADVRRLQNQLKALGYYTGSVDGDFGAGTEAAVKAFQRNNGLTADGKAGRYTLDKLYSDSARRAPAVTATPRPSSGGSSSSGSSSSSNSSNAYTNGETDIYLRLGSSGKQVKIMQNRLIVLGYLTGTADGEFDAATESGVKAFQDRNSIYDDGVAGPDTLTRLYSSSARKASSPAAHLGSLSEGAQGDAVRSLQKNLRTLGYYNGSVDGDYGSGTTAAVIAFQKAYGLTADGIAGKGTLNKIQSVLSGGSSSSGSSGGKNSPEVYGLTASSNGYSSLSPSNGSSANVAALQSSLHSNGYYSGNPDGDYGSATEAAVKAYQKAAGLRVTGVAGPSTQRLLYGGTQETGSYSKLEMGSSGSAVKRLQYALYELKYYDGEIDGKYETATYNAVLMFQDVNGLYVDGIAGQDTQRRLFSSYAVPSNI